MKKICLKIEKKWVIFALVAIYFYILPITTVLEKDGSVEIYVFVLSTNLMFWGPLRYWLTYYLYNKYDKTCNFTDAIDKHFKWLHVFLVLLIIWEIFILGEADIKFVFSHSYLSELAQAYWNSLELPSFIPVFIPIYFSIIKKRHLDNRFVRYLFNAFFWFFCIFFVFIPFIFGCIIELSAWYSILDSY